MFSSSNPFPSSIHGLPPVFSQEKDGVFFNNSPFFTGEFSSFDHTVKDSGLQSFDDHNHQKLSDSVISPSRKRVAANSKKDRHSKIFTAQGPRDRRVRLSIDISRKFFGLQDLLGFDKASKTLDWLFKTSKTAIKDLVEEMKNTSSSTLSDQCEAVFMEKGDFADKNGRNSKKKKQVANNGGKRKKKTSQKQKSGFQVINLAVRSQQRAEARSRARERTIEKLRIKKLGNNAKSVLAVPDFGYLQSNCGNGIQLKCNHEVKIKESLTETKLPKLPKPYSLIYNSQFKNNGH